MNNLFPHENLLRVFLGAVLVALGVAWGLYALFLPALFLLYTGTKAQCPIYAAMKVNDEQAKRQFYQAQLPRNNPAPVFILASNGTAVFQNEQASDELIQQVDLAQLRQEFGHAKDFSRLYDHDGRKFLIRFVTAQELDLIFCYAFDATELYAMRQEIVATQKEIIYKMGEIGETRSRETGNHVKRVAEYSYLLAKLAGISETEAEILKIASPMHDIGKVGIPDSILKKPGPLDADEWKIMKTHTDIGYKLLRHSDRPILKAAAIVAKEHHEKWDGSGYPEGKTGEAIHLFGRITAIADVFDALGSERVYKKAWELEKILDLFREQQGKYFDSQLVALFFENLDQFLAIRNRLADEPLPNECS